jgi:hypothetical protein
MTLLVVLAGCAVALAVRLAVRWLRRVRIASELRGDWWPRFEQDFHDYASLSWASAREAERHA